MIRKLREMTGQTNLKNADAIEIKIADKVQVTFHTLRHTFATRAIEQGMEIPVLSKILGHADISTTLNKYCHAIPDRKRENMEKIQCLYEDSLESKI